ncbi:MAG: hypothetical protein RA160_02850 [Arsenophonus sp.]|nr:MAG: hypothetical protein RA160_02850 [Arsenophonus sp.]
MQNHDVITLSSIFPKILSRNHITLLILCDIFLLILLFFKEERKVETSINL